MQKQKIFRITLTLLMIFAVSALLLQAQTDAELLKEYEKIFGDYEFDMSDLGMGVLGANFYIENGSFYAMADTSSRPAEMFPVAGKKFAFSIDDPDDGHFDIIFLKDDQGKYTKCRLINEDMGLDVTGDKIE